MCSKLNFNNFISNLLRSNYQSSLDVLGLDFDNISKHHGTCHSITTPIHSPCHPTQGVITNAPGTKERCTDLALCVPGWHENTKNITSLPPPELLRQVSSPTTASYFKSSNKLMFVTYSGLLGVRYSFLEHLLMDGLSSRLPTGCHFSSNYRL